MLLLTDVITVLVSSKYTKLYHNFLIFVFFQVFSNGNLISVLCGKREFEELQSTVNPTLLSSPGGCLSLLFHSDYSNTKRHTGFRGFYTDQGETKTRTTREMLLYEPQQSPLCLCPIYFSTFARSAHFVHACISSL